MNRGAKIFGPTLVRYMFGGLYVGSLKEREV